MDDTEAPRPDDEPDGDSTVDRTVAGHNSEAVPDPTADPDETGKAAAEEVERLEDHSRPSAGTGGPAAGRRGGPPPS